MPDQNADVRRKFGVGDGLILIAGVGAGLGMIRVLYPDEDPKAVWALLADPDQEWSWDHLLDICLNLTPSIFLPFVTGWTPACLLLQLLRPRPPWRRLRRQPGFAACLIATVVAAIVATVALTCLKLSIWEPRGLVPAFTSGILGSTVAGLGVLWCWVTMILCGACRPRATWTDRLVQSQAGCCESGSSRSQS
jgi:hypothetical protein